MSKVTFITSTGNPRADKIFTGVFGSLNDAGQFEVAPELKGIHLLNLMTPEILAEQGIDLSSSTCTVEVPDEVEMGFKATVLNALSECWNRLYDLENIPAGFARAAIDAEKASVSAAVNAAITSMRLVPQYLNISRSFENVVTVEGYDHDNPLSFDQIADRVSINAAYLATYHVFAEPWYFTGAKADAVSSSSTSIVDYASGTISSQLTVYAEPGHTEELNVQRVLDAVTSLPRTLLNLFDLAEKSYISNVEFHAEMRYDTPQALEMAEPPPAS